MYVNIISEVGLVSHLASNSIQVSGSLGSKSATTERKRTTIMKTKKWGNIIEYINLYNFVKSIQKMPKPSITRLLLYATLTTILQLRKASCQYSIYTCRQESIINPETKAIQNGISFSCPLELNKKPSQSISPLVTVRLHHYCRLAEQNSSSCT